MAKTENTDVVEAAKNKQVSATVSAETYEKLQSIRWTVKADRFTDVVRIAVEEFVAKHEAPAQDEQHGE